MRDIYNFSFLYCMDNQYSAVTFAMKAFTDIKDTKIRQSPGMWAYGGILIKY